MLQAYHTSLKEYYYGHINATSEYYINQDHNDSFQIGYPGKPGNN